MATGNLRINKLVFIGAGNMAEAIVKGVTTSGVCPGGTTPIYRGFRTAAGGKTSNHRYSASQATYDAAVATGYVGEGVAFCVTAATAATAAPTWACPSVRSGSLSPCRAPTQATSA